MKKISSGDQLRMKVNLAHLQGDDNYYKCKKCDHYICWCCGDVCDFFDHEKEDCCPCMNEGCEVEIEV